MSLISLGRAGRTGRRGSRREPVFRSGMRNSPMKRRISLCLAVWGLAASFCPAGIPTDTFTISVSGDKAYLSVRLGALKVGDAPHDVDWEGRPAPGRWYIEGTRIKSSVG